MNINRFSNRAVTVDESKRSFLKLSAGTTAGLMLGINLSANAQQASESALEYNAFVAISPDNKVRVYIKHIEMGQGVFTGLATCVAEELDADWSQVVCEHAPVDTSKYANLFMGQQATGGSTAIANSFIQMRRAGAAAKAMLVAAAAERWGVEPDQILRQLVSHSELRLESFERVQTSLDEIFVRVVSGDQA